MTAKTYHGKPCKSGHTLRRMSDRSCVACARAYRKQWRVDNAGRSRTYGKKWRDNNPDAEKKRYADMKETDPRRALLVGARSRASIRGMACTITVDDIRIPECCPLLGIALKVSKGRLNPNSPSLDRILNEYGYVPGNVHVVSYLANAIKRDVSAVQLRRMADSLQKIEQMAHAAITK